MLSLLFLAVGLLVADLVWARRDALGNKAWAGAALVVGCFVAAALVLPSMIYAQKIIGLLLMPIGLIWSALGLSALGARAARHNRWAAWFAALFLAFGLGANPWLGRTLLANLEADFAAVDPLQAGPFDAVFVLGGGTSLDGVGNPILGGSGDRVMLGARMWHAERTKHLVASGSSIAGIGKARDVARETELIWESIGVPDDHVTILSAPRNTSEEIRAYAKLSQERGYKRVGLVTSAWHMRRAVKLAERQDFGVHPLPADFRGGGGFDGVISLVPSGFGARDMHRAAWEYLGAAVGR